MKQRSSLMWVLVFMATLCSSAFSAQDPDYPWSVELRSFYDRTGPTNSGESLSWLLNLGPTGIRARHYPDRPHQLIVKYVFEDAKCPAKGKIDKEDAIVGANGKMFAPVDYQFRKSGWKGPMMDLAGHIEDSQGKDGILTLIVWPKGDKTKQKDVKIELKKVGRFAATFPYNCPRSDKLLEELCDFIVMDYESDNWKKKNTFSEKHGTAHGMLALMGSGIPKYEPLIKKILVGYYDNKYDPTDGGFVMWKFGFDSIVMGEAYRLYKDTKLIPAIESLAKAMPGGSQWENGIYTHRSYLNIKARGGKPYASIAAISGLQMLGMSLFKANGLPYDKALYERIHQHYLGSTNEDAVNIAYAFGDSNKNHTGSNGRDPRHAYVKMKDPTKCLSGKGPGYQCPTGMKGITPKDYEIIWPTTADHRFKPLDWVVAEANENLVEEEVDGFRTFIRYTGAKKYLEPIGPYKTTKGGNHLAPIGMGTLSHLIGNKGNTSWNYLAYHAANTCAHNAGSAFDGHASSNLAGFWSILGAARSDDPAKLRAYFDYIKTFIILSECHNGGLYLQPWGRDRVNSDAGYGPRSLPTATGAILLALSKKRLLITGAEESGTGSGSSGSVASGTGKPTLVAQPAQVPATPPNATTATQPKAGEPSQTTPGLKNATAPATAGAPATASTPPIEGTPTTAAVPATAGTPAVAAIGSASADLRNEWIGRLRTWVVASAKAGKPLKGMVNAAGKTAVYPLVGADEKTLQVEINKTAMPLNWSWLKPKDLVMLARSLANDKDAESQLILSGFYFLNGDNAAGENAFAKAQLLDASAAAKARELLPIKAQ